MAKLSDIIALEYQLSQIKLEINTLAATSNAQVNEPELIRDRIVFLEYQVQHLSNQLAILKKSLDDPEALKQTEAISQVEETPMAEAPVTTTPTVESPVVPISTAAKEASASPVTVVTKESQPLPVAPTVVKPQPTTVSPTYKPRDFEHTIGQNVMGIVASVLTFIGLILFGYIIYPHLTDTIRLIIMYLFSFGITAVGAIGSKKKPENKFFTSFLACGTGAVFISLLMTNIYFKLINEIVLYLLLFAWSGIVCFIAKKKGRVFQIIGELGLLISYVFGIAYCDMEQSQIYAFVLLLYFIITSTLYLIIQYQVELENNKIHFTMHMLSTYTFLAGCIFFNDFFDPAASLIWGWLFVAYTLAHIVIANFLMQQKGTTMVSLLNILYMPVLSCVILYTPLGGDITGVLINTVLCLAVLGLNARSIPAKALGRILADVVAILFLFIGMLSLRETPILQEVLYLGLAFLGLYVGLRFQNQVYQIAGYLFLFAFIVDDDLNKYVYVGLTLAAMISLVILTKKYYKQSIKLTNYIFFLCFALNIIDLGQDLLAKVIADSETLSEAKRFLTINVFSAIQFAVIGFGLDKNWITKEKERASLYVFGGMHLLLMLASSFYIYNNSTLRVIMILVAIAIFIINNKRIMQVSTSLWPGLYIGFKTSWLIVMTIQAYQVASYYVSIVCFLFAVLCIIYGFRMKYKGFRTYGLVLSLISVVKLILLDIEYDNSLGRAISFFVCGALCFVINIIYNRVEKQERKLQEAQERKPQEFQGQ